MSVKLFKYLTKGYFKQTVVLFAALTAATLLAVGAGHIDIPVFHIVSIILMIASILLISALFLVAFLLYFQSILNCLYNRQAGLIRLLPLERSQIYWTLVVCALTISAIGTAIFGAWFLCIANADIIPDMMDVFYGQDQLVVGLLLAFFCQTCVVLITGMSAILLGYSRKSSKLGFSILFGFVIYYVLEFVMVGLIFVIGMAAGFPIFDDSLVLTTGDIWSVLMLICALYVAAFALMAWIDGRKVVRGVDIDG